MVTGRYEERIPPTRERFAKGDLAIHTDERGAFLSASVRDDSVLAYLIGKGHLDDLHGYYAMVFQDLRRAFLLRVGYRNNSAYAREFFGSDNSDGEFETMYLRVCRLMGRHNEGVVAFAINGRACASNVPMLLVNRREYRSAFDALVRAVDEMRRESHRRSK